MYKLKMFDTWRIHDVFHLSLLKPWKQSLFSVAQQQVVPEVEAPKAEQSYGTKKVLR